jgi:hypothetical protein
MDEQQKKEILERRVENRKLSEIIQQGTRYHESVSVKGIDGEMHEVEVYALSENEFRELFEGAGADPRDIGNRDKLVQNMKFLESVAAKATRDEKICTVLMPNQSAEIMMKAFNISGLTATESKMAESFQSRDLQSESIRANRALRPAT